MRTLWSLVVASVVPLTGCCVPSSTCGWRFEMGRAPTITSSALVQPQATLYGAYPLATGPLAGPLGPVQALPLAPPAALPSAAPCGPALPLQATPNDVLRELRSLQQRLPAPAPAAAPMPPAAPGCALASWADWQTDPAGERPAE